MDAHNEMLRADNKTLSKRIRDIEALLDEIRELPRHDEARHLIELFLSCGDHAIMDFQGAHHEA